MSRRLVFRNERRAVPSPLILSPLQVAGLLAWHDLQGVNSGDGTSVTNMASGVAWAEAVVPPGYDATGLNGRPCLTFNGTTQRILSTEAATLAAFVGSTKTLTYMTVVEPASGDQQCAIFGAGSSGAAANHTWRIGMLNTGSGILGISKRGTSGTVTAQSAAQAPSTPKVITYWTNGSTASIWTNLTKELTAAAFADLEATSPNRMAIGAIPTSTIGNFYSGKWAGGALYSRALNDLEIMALARGQMDRWGIS